MADYVTEELALLRGVVKNPYDRAGLSAYADWLLEHGRDGEAAGVRAHSEALAPAVNGNSISVGELIGHLLTFPLNVPVIFQMCSDWSELQRDEVVLVKAEDRRICHRPEQGYADYTDYRWRGQTEEPHFVTVVCLPGN